MSKLLLVIGNGFDKWCGLESSFSEFMDYRRKKTPKLYMAIHNFSNHGMISPNAIGQVLREFYEDLDSSFLIWDLIFLLNSSFNKDKIMWCDVEQILNRYLGGFYSKNSDRNYWNAIEKTIIEGNRYQTLTSMISMDSFETLTPYIILYLEKISYIFTSNGSKFIYELLYSHLRRFEEDFCDYLNIMIKSNENYESNKNLLLDKLTKSSHNFDETRVLSFNYTSINYPNTPIKVENVHGTLIDNNCIIGIDNSEIEYLNPIYRFTKTYRKVDYFSKNKSKNIENVLLNDYTHVTFFGHSLNEQDKAYFQSIFDTLDIYEKNVNLLFLYSVYDESKRDQIQTEMTSRVVGLLEKYGRSFTSSPAKGKNLLHKLLISSRLKIREIPQKVEDMNLIDGLYETL